MPFVPPKLADHQIKNFKIGLATARSWAQANGKDATKVQQRLAFAAWTESRGRNLCNNGNAFAKLTTWSRGLSEEKCKVLRYILRTSMTIPNDGEGENGGSTGWLQQLSNTYVMEMFGKQWGYGTIAQTMDIPKSSIMFMERLAVTTSSVYNAKLKDGTPKSITGLDPIVRDVLTTQQPLWEEAVSDNYDNEKLNIALWLVEQYGNVLDPGKPGGPVIVDQTPANWLASLLHQN